MTSILETTRSIHQEIESQIKDSLTELTTNLHSRKASLERDLMIKKRINTISQSLTQLRSIYDDNENIYKGDLLTLLQLDSQRTFHQFDQDATKIIQKYNSTNSKLVNQEGVLAGVNPILFKEFVSLNDIFSNTEMRGKCLDLGPFHQRFVELLITTLISGYSESNNLTDIQQSFQQDELNDQAIATATTTPNNPQDNNSTHTMSDLPQISQNGQTIHKQIGRAHV